MLNAPTVWAFDMMVQMYGALFLMAGPYALAQDAHVRGGYSLSSVSVRWQARIDFVLVSLVLLPRHARPVLVRHGKSPGSWRYKEVSWNSPAQIQIYFFKTLIPVAGFLLILQGFAECSCAAGAMKTACGWRASTTCQETEDALMEQA